MRLIERERVSKSERVCVRLREREGKTKTENTHEEQKCFGPYYTYIPSNFYLKKKTV